MSTVADATLASIRADGYHVSETSHVDCREQTERYLCVPEHKLSGETWTVRAADRDPSTHVGSQPRARTRR